MAINKKNIIIAVILVVIALASFFVLAESFTEPDAFEGTVTALNEKEKTVMKMSGVAIAAASAIDLIPGDAGKSVSTQLVNLGGYFVLLFAAIYLEKLLVTIGASLALKILIPLGLLLLAGFFVLQSEMLKSLGTKLVSVGLVLMLIVPASVWVSDMVDKSHDESRQAAIEQFSEETGLEEDQEQATETKESKKGLAAFFGNSKETLSAAANKVKDLPAKASALLTNLVEEVAYFFVSICIIPIVVLLLLIVLINQILGINVGGISGVNSMIREMKSMKRELKSEE